ncbi:MAG: hypothetical protein LBR00_03810 [Clostridiales Family XIII bacterium]|jgi:hypothetical protein|nr:hypothetical protein [Clostridiales Family XIII bacterium]
MDSIAVFVDKAGAPALPEEAVAIRVAAAAEGGAWRTEKTVPAALDFGGPGPLNKSLRALVAELGGCRIVLAKAIAGIPYHVFVHSGFEVYESEDASDETLTAILEEARALAETARAAEAGDLAEDPEGVPTSPQPTSVCGVYYLDLTRMQKAHPEVTTKMALKDFLRKDFQELRLAFSHVPPWLAADVSACRATMLSTETAPGTWKVVIRKKGATET